MDGESSVPLDTVLRVLAKNGVSISIEAGENSHMVKLAKGDHIEVVILTDPVRKRMLQRFARKFGCHVYLFYNPEMVAGQGPDTIQ